MNGDSMEQFMHHNFVIGEITFANVVKAGEGAKVHTNRKSHGLAFFPGGERIICFDDRRLKVGENTLVFFPKGSNYTIRDKSPYDCYAINFEMPDGVSFQPFAVKVKNVSACLESFKQAQRCQARKDPGYISKIKSALYSIIYHIQSEYHSPYVNYKVIEPAVEYIHRNYDKENISIAYLASLCGISTVYLRNIFAKKFAVSPVKYINNLKMTRAWELLSSQFYTVSQVCFLVGYNDESHFCREFKKNFNITPSVCIKNSRE